jgi:uncharacterized protein (TIRG00374 family)
MTDRRRHFVLLGIAVSAVLLWLSVRGTNLSEIGAALAAANPIWIVPYLLALCSSYWLKALRWRWLLSSACDARAGQLFAPIMIGHLGNLALPAQLGELVRVACAARQLHIPASTAFSSIVLERIFDLLTVLFVFGVALLLGADASPLLMRAGTAVAAIAMALTILTAAYLAWTQRFVWFVGVVTAKLPQKARDPLLSSLEQGATGVQTLRQPSVLVRVVAYSILQWSCLLLCVHLSLIALGIEVPIAAPLLVLGFAVVSVTLPTSPGFVGAIQIAFAIGLEPFGVGADRAVAASVYYHVLAVAAVLVLGLFSLKQMGQTFRRAREEAERIEIG